MTSVEGVDLASTVLALRRIGDDQRLLSMVEVSKVWKVLWRVVKCTPPSCEMRGLQEHERR
jgi:hypothetical protein